MHALLLLLASTTAANAAPIFPYEMQQTTLDNGLRVVVVPTDARGMFSLYSVVGTGSRDEVEAGHSGFAHFFEHMMFRGTKKYSADQRVALLTSLGVEENGFTTDDFTAYPLSGPKEALPKIIELEGDRYQNLEYSDDAFKIESKAVLGEYNKNFSNPDQKAYEVLTDLAFDKHTYKHTTMGFLKDIENMPNEAAYSRAFFKKFYTPDNVILYVVGDVDPATVLAQVKASFGSWKGHRALTDVKDEPPLNKERRKAVPWENPTLERLHVAWRVPSGTRDTKAGALGLLLSGYLFSDSSALVKDLVIDEQLAEAVNNDYRIHKDASLFAVSSRIKRSSSSDAVLAKIQTALDDLASGKVDTARFDAVRSNLRYSMLMGLTSAPAVGRTIAVASGPFLDPKALDLVLAAEAAASPQDLVAYTKQWFGKDQRAVVTLASAAVGGAK
ncbi:MAG TPA: pitrilysin family protein [Myxococcota bacterium]